MLTEKNPRVDELFLIRQNIVQVCTIIQVFICSLATSKAAEYEP